MIPIHLHTQATMCDLVFTLIFLLYPPKLIKYRPVYTLQNTRLWSVANLSSGAYHAMIRIIHL